MHQTNHAIVISPHAKSNVYRVAIIVELQKVNVSINHA